MKYLYRFTLSFFFLLMPALAVAQVDFDSLLSDEPEFLLVDEAFQFDFNQNDNKVKLVWTIADGYYLYKEKFKFAGIDAEIGHVQKPVGKSHEDEYFGTTEIYLHQVVLTVPIKESIEGGQLKVRFQGCADAGLCYPPKTKVIDLAKVIDDGSVSAAPAPAKPKGPATAIAEQKEQTKAATKAPAAESQQNTLAKELADKSLWLNLIAFFILGIGLAFTPCVFPMYPILSGIIAGQGEQLTAKRGFTLSMVYVQGMAITYSLLGLVVASAGLQYQAALQHPYVLIGISVLFILLALSMFGLYDLRMPSSWQEKFNNMSNTQKGGQLKGVFVMGVISGLVASPCTTAPLSGVLIYIAQTGDIVFGGLTLYALSLGMGIPLLVIGTSGGKILPKAGMWMNLVKVAFGFALLAVPIILLERIINPETAAMLWAGLGVMTAGYFLQAKQDISSALWQGIIRVVMIVMLIVSVLTAHHAYEKQNEGPVSITANSQSAETTSEHSDTGDFIMVASLTELDKQVALASEQGKSVMVDLYADWCVACKEFEHLTFPEASVQQALANTVLIQVDVTNTNDDNIALLEQFDVLGLPTILFFDTSGMEVSHRRVTGFMDATEFSTHVNDTLN